MTDWREDAIEAAFEAMLRVDGRVSDNALAAVVDAVAERIRADERERMERDGLLMTCTCGCAERDAHAEAVAARLVEVVCRQERTRLIHVETIHALSDDADVLRAERDAARAEVAALLHIRGVIEAEVERVSLNEEVRDVLNRDEAQP